MPSIEDRVRALEHQLAALVSALGAPPPTQVHPSLDSPSSGSLEPETTQAPHNPYFALDALKSELPAPGGVVFAGAVDLPGERRVDWQFGLTTEVVLEEDWVGRADTIAALGHPARLQIVQEVLLGLATVAELSRINGLGTSGQVYHHLRMLIGAGWLQTTSRGRYEVPTTRIVPLLALVLAARR